MSFGPRNDHKLSVRLRAYWDSPNGEDAIYLVINTACASIVVYLAIKLLAHSRPDVSYAVLSFGIFFGLAFATILLGPAKRYSKNAFAYAGIVLGIFAILIVLFFYHEFAKFASKAEAHSVVDDANLAIAVTAFGVTIVTICATIGATWISMNVIEIRSHQQELIRTVANTAELALHGLPRYWESQQIPHNWNEPLEKITNFVFDESDDAIIRYLDKTGNGVRLRLARANYLYGIADYDEHRKILEQAILHCRAADPRDKGQIYYRLGIYFRQRGIRDSTLSDLKMSFDAFYELAKIAERSGNHRESLLHQAFIGSAISTLSLFRTGLVDGDPDFVGRLTTKLHDLRTRSEKAQQVWSEALAQIVAAPKGGDKGRLLYEAYCLLKHVASINKSNGMAHIYCLKLLNELHDDLLPQDDSAFRNGLAATTYGLIYDLRNKDDLDLYASYSYAMALCKSYLKDPDYDGAIELLGEAKQKASTLATLAPASYIYSEEQELMIRSAEFTVEAERRITSTKALKKKGRAAPHQINIQ